MEKNTKNGKKVLYLVLMAVFLAVSMSLLLGFRALARAYAYDILDEINTIDKKNDSYSNNEIIVVLTAAETKLFREYSPSDFKDVGAVSVKDIAQETVKWVQKEINGKANNKNSLINVEKYKRSLCITLAESGEENVLSAVDLLIQRSEIETAFPNYHLQVTSTYVSDTQRNKQWGLDTIKANDAWDVSMGTETVLVGVMDSGIDSSHLDLTNRIYRESPHSIENTLHRDFTTGKAEKVLTPTDPCGHGTHVAGIIAAESNNGGVAGVAADVRLVSLRVFDANGYGEIEWFLNAVNYASLQGISILNYSGGGYDWAEKLDEAEEAISGYNGLIIVAAGNDGRDNDSNMPSYPASITSENIISVGASDKNNKRSDWNGFLNLWGFLGNSSSNYGATSVDLFAPGTDILSTYPNNKYKEKSGTSMAAPFVTGVAALMLSHNQNLTANEIKTIIMETVTPSADLVGKCVTGGILNAEAALKSIGYALTNKSNNCVEIAGTYFYPKGNWKIPTILNGKNVTSIGYKAFERGTFMTSVTIPATVESLGSSAFSGCTNLQTVTFENGSNLTTIGDHTFNNCQKLKTITIPSGVTKIYGSAFGCCYDLENVIIPSNSQLTEIGAMAFDLCTSLQSFTIPAGVVKIDHNAFYNCSNLRNVTIPANSQLNEIGQGAFRRCNNLRSIYIPAGVTIMKPYTFRECSLLSSVNFASNSALNTIDADAFYGCTSLESIAVPEGVTSIWESAFGGCTALTEFSAPKSVTKIVSFAFKNCTQLHKVVLNNQTAAVELGTKCFQGTASDLKIYVPEGLYSDYCSGANAADYENYLVGAAADGGGLYYTQTQQISGENYITCDAYFFTSYSGPLKLNDDVGRIGRDQFYEMLSYLWVEYPFESLVDCQLIIDVGAGEDCLIFKTDMTFVGYCPYEDGCLIVPFMPLYESGVTEFYIFAAREGALLMEFYPSDVTIEIVQKFYL